MDSFERFSKKKILDKKHFYRSLKDGATKDKDEKLGGHITDEEYLTCIKIWNRINMKNIVDYHDHYLKKDVMLLADIFEKFTIELLKLYKLDPSHYFSSPELSWYAMLNMTGIKLGLISDIGKHLFIEKGLRGGISCICKRFIRANNKYMKNCDPKKEKKFIMYRDEKNLYGWGLNQYISYCKFQWLKNVDQFDKNSVSENSSVGYIPEDDLEYPDELHYLPNDYSLAPEELAISYDTLSNYCKKMADKYGIKVGDLKRLVPNLGNKTNYPVHYRNLIYHLE